MRLFSQMLAPPHSFHLLLSRLCSQMLAPPHCLHLVLLQLCSQMLAPPHCLHPLLCSCARRCSPRRIACTCFFGGCVGTASSPSSLAVVWAQLLSLFSTALFVVRSMSLLFALVACRPNSLLVCLLSASFHMNEAATFSLAFFRRLSFFSLPFSPPAPTVLDLSDKGHFLFSTASPFPLP